jgi:hypothetical protein
MRPAEEPAASTLISPTPRNLQQLNSPRRHHRTIRSHRMPHPMPGQNPHQKTRKPAHRRQKAKSLRSIPLPTVILRQINVAPIPNTTALNLVIVVVLEQAEDREPRSAEEEISADVDEGGGAVQHPDDGDPQTDRGYDGAEDKAVEGADVVGGVLVEEVGA